MIYHLKPNIQRKIWGGKKLETIKNIVPESGVDPVGETWEISIHPDGPSFFNDNKFEIEETTEELTYLVKLIDTSDELSVQVHPGDKYARLHENSSGKSECWLILNAEKNAGVYLGLKDGVTQEAFLEGLKKKANMSTFLNFYPVSPGDFFYVPAGTIHAIGGGITLAEVQQSSGITYRVWDWNRLDSKGNPRELHVQKSLDVINFDPRSNNKTFFRIEHDLFSFSGKKELIDHAAFKLSLINLKKGESLEIDIPRKKRLTSILNLHGHLLVNGESLAAYSAAVFRDENKLIISGYEDTAILFLE